MDTSLLTAYYRSEPCSAEVRAHLTSGIVPLISRLIETELVSALSKKIRMRELEPGQGRRALELFGSQVDASFKLVPVTVADLRTATVYIGRFDTALRTLDAIHAAVAARERATLATAGVRLANAATVLGIDATLLVST